jgi:hypothetical protein
MPSGCGKTRAIGALIVRAVILAGIFRIGVTDFGNRALEHPITSLVICAG